MRGLRRAPGFAAATILTLALGIGAATSVFSVAYGVLFAPLPVRDADRVVALWAHNPTKQPEHFPLSGDEYTAFSHEARSFSQIAAVDYNGTLPRLIQFGDTVASIPAALVTGGFFDVLGAHALIGRLLRPDDDLNGAPFVAVLSERLWRSAYGADPSVIGRTTKFYLRDMTIVGVVAGGLDFPRGTELWASWPNYVNAGKKDTLAGFFDVVARLAPGARRIDAQNELGAFLARADEPHSGVRKLAGQLLQPVAMTLTDVIVGDVRPVLRVVLGAVALLLLVTCVNVANLMLVRTVARRREFAVRAALGAGRRRIAQQVLVESAVLSAVGGALGILCSWYAVHAFAQFAPPEVPRAHDIAMHAPVLLVAIGICAAVALLFGCVPALGSARASLADSLRERSAGDTGHTAHRVRALLVGTQVAVAVAVLVGASVVLRSFESLAHRNLGFQPDNLIIARFGQTTQSFGDMSAWNNVVDAAIQQVHRLPGVTHATALTLPPFRVAGNDLVYSLPGDTPGLSTNRPLANYLGADADYFQTLGIALHRGRVFTNNDRRGSARVAVVDELLARQAWPGKDPIGQLIGVDTVFYTVVGVVAPTRYRDLLAPRATLYTAYSQSTFGPGYIAVRASVDAAALEPALRAAVRASDSRVYLADFATMDNRVDASLATERLSAFLLGAFAVAIVLLTGVGLYGVAATFVRHREFEIGVRAALGATPAQIAQLVAREGVMVILVGMTVGIIGALAAGSVLRSIVYGTSTRDPGAFAVAIGIVFVVAALAFAIPGRRASRANAADVLRRG